MKKYLSIFVFAVMALVCLSSCGKDDDDIPSTTSTSSTTGVAKRTGDIDVRWVQLWKNGPKFAEYNVGAANNNAEDYGGLYCWGKSIDLDPNSKFKSGTYPLTGTDDTATNLWGSNWRMPTKEEFDALLANCDFERTTAYSVTGYKFTGKNGYSSNSVFFPDAGLSAGDYVIDDRSVCEYWSSTPDGSEYAYFLVFFSEAQKVGHDRRSYGHSVRAVLAE